MAPPRPARSMAGPWLTAAALVVTWTTTHSNTWRAEATSLGGCPFSDPNDCVSTGCEPSECPAGFVGVDSFFCMNPGYGPYQNETYFGANWKCCRITEYCSPPPQPPVPPIALPPPIPPPDAPRAHPTPYPSFVSKPQWMGPRRPRREAGRGNGALGAAHPTSPSQLYRHTECIGEGGGVHVQCRRRRWWWTRRWMRRRASRRS